MRYDANGREYHRFAYTTDADLLLSCGYILSKLRYDKGTVRMLFAGVEKMKKSSAYRLQTVPPEMESKVRVATDLTKLQIAILQVYRVNAPNELPLD